MSPFTLRAMRANDLPAILDIQRACYGDGFVENADVFARRLLAAPDTAWVMVRADDGPCAYLSAYPSLRGQLTALHGDFHPAGAAADTLYLHDLAVHPDAHGAGLGPTLVRHALAVARARGWVHAALVSVQDSLAFWQRQGFAVQPLQDAALIDKLAGYDAPAHYMARSNR